MWCEYTEIDGEGTPFVSSNNMYNGKSIWSIQGQLFTFKDTVNGVAAEDVTITESKSSYDWENDLLTNSTNAISAGNKVYVLEEITRTDIGLPDSIVLPLNIVFE